jgi:hypothetical protein
VLKKVNRTWDMYNTLKDTKFQFISLPWKDIVLYNFILLDMMYYLKIWRLIKGYSSNGQRSHSNNKANKKNKLIVNFRVQQFYKLFGKKRRDIFPTLVVAEYNNRLWFILWRHGWIQGRIFILKLALKNKFIVKFDPNLLSKNVVTGIETVRKKKKHNVAKKKIIMLATVGVPVLFSMYLYGLWDYKDIHFKLSLTDDSRKKMGKKSKKTKKKK